MSKAEGTAGKKAPERWPGWCEDIDGRVGGSQGGGQIRQGLECNGRVLIKARRVI